MAVKTAGKTHSGMTIHFANEHYDEGDIVFQATCVLHPDDTPDDIARKVLELEHRHFAPVIEQVLNDLPEKVAHRPMQAIKNKHLTIIICSALIAVCSQALCLHSILDLIEEGERLRGFFSEAAEKFERAGRIKSADPDLMLRAGDAYIQARDYRKSGVCLSAARQEREEYPLASLRYARALKQCGRYDEAIDAFKKFSKQSRANKHAQLLDIARMEKTGCQLALDILNQPPTDEPQPRLTRLPSTVNQAGNEYAPMSVMEGLLYFCLPSFEGKGKLYRTIFDDSTNNWSKYELASGLPVAVASRFGSGVLSPDGQRFYCTQCDPGGRRTIAMMAAVRVIANWWLCGVRLTDNGVILKNCQPISICREPAIFILP